MNQPSKLASRGIAIAGAIVIGMTLLSGAVHGYLDGRWRPAEDLVATRFHVSELPDRCGDWVMIDNPPLADFAQDMLRCYGSDIRVYKNEQTNASVRVALLFGPRGPIAIHTPEVCFRSTGTRQAGARTAEAVETQDENHEFWAAEFIRDPNPNPSIDSWWAWSDGGAWKASDSPRFWLTEHLFKIQVAGPVADDNGHPCRDFLAAFLPYVARVIE